MLEIYKLDRALMPEGGIEEMMAIIMRKKGYPGFMEFGYNSYGKPYMDAFPDIHFNGSHSGEYLVCALSSSPVGIDIQKIEDKLGIIRLAERFFSPREIKCLKKVDTERQGPAFYRLWAQNEAYMKYTGLGFALPMSEFSVCQVNGRYQVVQNDAPIEDLAMLPVRIEGGYEGWVCTECKDTHPQIITLTEEDCRLI